ncbi:MAG: serine hydrolase [Candidatus Cloacimonetes bacterium]|nr:serine hydrolase [Candidatus Cloacimonadota bacterium]
MKRILLPFLLTGLLLISCNKTSTKPLNDEQILQQNVQNSIDENWQKYLSENEIAAGGVLFHAKLGNQEVFCKSNLQSNVTETSLFRAASITKTFTAAGIMLLEQQGALNINDIVTSNIPGKDTPYLPESENYNIPFKNQITIRQLLEHRAGVFDLTNISIPDTVSALYAGQNWISYILEQDPVHQFSTDEIIEVISDNGLYVNQPGEEYNYSNTGYMLLGKIIERISGFSYEQFLQQELLIPNNLIHTSFPTDPMHHLPEPYIPCQVFSQGSYINTDIYNMSYEQAQGNLVTNSSDLLSWLLKWQKGTSGLSMETVLNMRVSSYTDQKYGLGTEYMEGFGYGHTGAIAGFLTLMYYDPTSDFGFVIVSNIWDLSNSESLNLQAYALFDIVAEAKRIIINTDKFD